jgi:putative DNA primase/helicase
VKLDELKRRASGRWRDILSSLGVESAVLSPKQNKPCPFCAGSDRFSYIDKKGDGYWLCRVCQPGGGTGLDFVMRKFNCDLIEAARRVEEVVGSARAWKPKPKASPARRRKLMGELWAGARPIEGEHPNAAWLYLAKRGLPPPYDPAALRYRRVWHEGKERPCMLARVINAEGTQAVQLHQTFLDELGNKAPCDKVRKIFWGEHPAGSAVRLAAHGDALGIAEGIETALAAMQLFSVPVWAALTARRLREWQPPAGVGAVVVFGDNDLKFAGQASAYALAERLSARKEGLAVEVRIPPLPGEDWNDVLRERLRAGARWPTIAAPMAETTPTEDLSDGRD